MSTPIDRTGDTALLRDLKDERAKLTRFLRWHEQSHRSNDEWRGDAIESREFVSGNQWSQADIERRKKARRPFITINKILPRVLFLLGLQRSQREEPKLLPFEGGDARAAELMGALYKWFGTKAREPVVDTAVFNDKIVSGLGFWKVGWQYRGEPEGQLLWERADPLGVFPDPNWLDAGWNNAEYVIQATWMTLPDALAQWPEHADELRHSYGEWLSEGLSTSSNGQFGGGGEYAGDSFSTERTWWDPETQRLRVLEVWYKHHEMVEMVMREDTGETVSEPDRVQGMKEFVQQNPGHPFAANLSFLRMPAVKICLAHVTDQILLSDQPSPYECQELPFFPTLAYYWWKKPFGTVHPLKDLAREGNLRRSTIIEMVMRSALSGFFNAETAGAKKEDLENYSAGTGKVINFKTVKPEEIQAPQLPQALVFLDRAADEDMNKVSNIHAELLGNTTARTVSGRAIKARQQSGLVVQEPLMESLRQDKEPAVRFAIELIQQFCTPPQALRILGSIVMRDQQGEMAKMMEGMAYIEVRELLSGAFSQEFDVTIGSQPFDPSQMQQRFDSLMEAAQAFPQYTPPGVIIDAAKKAGILTEDQAIAFTQFAEQQVQLQQAQQAAAASGHAPAAPGPPDQQINVGAA